MIVKSFNAGLINGITKAFQNVDKKVEEEVGPNATIISVTDTVYFQDEITKCNDATIGLPTLIRVVVYEK